MKGGLLAILGKPKGEPEEEEGEDSMETSSVAEEYAVDAYEAVKAGDKAGFVKAFIDAVKACGDTEY